MRLLDRLRGHASETQVPETPAQAPVCTHVTLIPHWDAASDIGDHSKASSWSCDACGATFSPAEARSLRATEAQRLKDTLGTN